MPLLIRRARILMPDGEFLTGDVLMAGSKIDRVEPEIAFDNGAKHCNLDNRSPVSRLLRLSFQKARLEVMEAVPRKNLTRHSPS